MRGQIGAGVSRAGGVSIMRRMAKRNENPPKNFEEALRELEQILGEIERGEVGLEESLVKYERGNFLIQHCQGVLNEAEKQIEQIGKNADGTLKATPMGDAGPTGK